MEVYLVQHGEAKPESEDPEKPLTDKGKAQVELVARNISKLGIRVSEIFHSGKLRAKQTAELFAQYVPAGSVMQQDGLGPLDDPETAKRLISETKEPIVIVGHLPHLSRLVSLLVLGNSEQEVVRFRMGGIVCLSRSNSNWGIDWAVIPELFQVETGGTENPIAEVNH